MTVGWIDRDSPNLTYYHAMQREIEPLGHKLSRIFYRHPGDRPKMHEIIETSDFVVVGFSWMSGEGRTYSPLNFAEFNRVACGMRLANHSRKLANHSRARHQSGVGHTAPVDQATSDGHPAAGDQLAGSAPRPLPRQLSLTGVMSKLSLGRRLEAMRRLSRRFAPRGNSTSSTPCYCGHVPLLVVLNKEYTAMPAKFHWFKAHCVSAALTVHHNASQFEAATGVPFHRITFGVDAGTFMAPPAASPTASRGYLYDIGFTGVLRRDQTANWRSEIMRHSWPRLKASGVRFFEPGLARTIHAGVAHATLGVDRYAAGIRSCKMWLSTTGPADLVGTRYFDIMATGTTLLVCNRMNSSSSAAYSSLPTPLVHGVNAVMFSSLDEFEQLVRYYASPAAEEERLAIVRRAQIAALANYTWTEVARKVMAVGRQELERSHAPAALQSSHIDSAR